MKTTPPKRFPRKLKKKYIKAWGRSVYKGILKGIYILYKATPYTQPNLNGRMYPMDMFTNNTISRYSDKKINPNYYGKIEIK